jgi:tellurite resistance protein TehA-like permease
MDWGNCAVGLMYYETKLSVFKSLSWIIFALLNLIILILIVKTAKAVKHKEICVEEE